MLPWPLHHRDPPSFPTRRSSDLKSVLVRREDRSNRHGDDQRSGDDDPLVRKLKAYEAIDQQDDAEDQTDRHGGRSEEHTSELQSPYDLVCRLLLEKKKTRNLQPH